jgi:tRNA pseudouridine55 synthase
MLGVVNLDKPAGPTSHDMVGLLRRLTGTRRIGHAGTLDPLASGVLPILIGAATRFSEELTAGPKRYEAVVRLGQRSATDDAEGPLTPGPGPLPEPARVAAGVTAFVGTFAQRPPAYSARKAGGRTAHRAARAGAPLELSPRTVSVESIEVLGFAPGPGWLDVELDIRCGPGTYVRSIARDLGEALGCGGHLAALRRTEASGLRVDDGWDPETLEALAEEGRLEEAVQPVAGLLRLPRVRLAADAARRFRHGSEVDVDAATPAGRVAVFDDGELLGIGRSAGGALQPEKVLPAVDG